MRGTILAAALLLTALVAPASAASSYPAKIAGRLVSTTASAVAKRLWSLKSAATKTAVAASGRSMVCYEGGYAVEMVFDGSKLGIEPHAVEVTPTSEQLVLDSINSNIYRVQLPLSRCEHARLRRGFVDGVAFDGRELVKFTSSPAAGDARAPGLFLRRTPGLLPPRCPAASSPAAGSARAPPSRAGGLPPARAKLRRVRWGPWGTSLLRPTAHR